MPPAPFKASNGWWKDPKRHQYGDVNGKAVIGQLFPKATVTSGYRGPDHPLSRKNPSSWHARRHGAIDMAPIPGMTFEQAAQRIIDAGYPLLEAGDEVNYPSSAATGPHWHFVLGSR